jgi:hypothetical protein
MGGESDVGGRRSRVTLDVGLQIVGAAGGALLFVYLLGAIALRIRLRALGLPQNQIVALLSRETLLESGLRSFLYPLAVYVAAVAPFAVLAWRRFRDRAFGPALVVVPFIAAVLGYTVLRDVGRWRTYWLLMLGLVALAALLWWYVTRLDRTLPTHAHPSVLIWRLAIVVFAAGAALTVGFEAIRTPRIAPAKVVRKSGLPVAGFYLGEGGDSIVLASGLCDETPSDDLGRAIVVPRGEVRALVLAQAIPVDDVPRKREAWSSLGLCGAEPAS